MLKRRLSHFTCNRSDKSRHAKMCHVFTISNKSCFPSSAGAAFNASISSHPSKWIACGNLGFALCICKKLSKAGVAYQYSSTHRQKHSSDLDWQEHSAFRNLPHCHFLIIFLATSVRCEGWCRSSWEYSCAACHPAQLPSADLRCCRNDTNSYFPHAFPPLRRRGTLLIWFLVIIYCCAAARARTSGRLKAHGSPFYSRSDDRGQNGLWSRDGGIHWKQHVFPKQRGRKGERKKKRVTERERRGRIWEQAGRATELMKNEWETWIRGGVDGEMRYFEGASVRWEAAHNNSITLNRFPSNAAWALKRSRHKWPQIVFTSSWNSWIPTATLSPKLGLGGFSPAAGCKLTTAQLHGWLSGEPIWRFTNSRRTGQMSNCSTVILRKFRLAGSIWIHLSWLLKFKFKTNPKYFTSISRLWDQPFLIFSAPTRLQWGTSGHLGHYLINWPAVLCISEGTGPLWATGVTRLHSGINGVKTPGGGLQGPLVLITVVPVWEDCSFTHLSTRWNWFRLCLSDVI